MTEFEFLTYAQGVGSAASESAMAYITVFSAYVVSAYLAGREMSLIQSIGLTFAYSVFSLLTIFSIFTAILGFAEIASKYPQYINNPQEVKIYLAGPSCLLLTWLMSVLFMISQNSKRTKIELDDAT